MQAVEEDASFRTVSEPVYTVHTVLARQAAVTLRYGIRRIAGPGLSV